MEVVVSLRRKLDCTQRDRVSEPPGNSPEALREKARVRGREKAGPRDILGKEEMTDSGGGGGGGGHKG